MLRITTEGKGAVDTDPQQPFHGLGQVVRLAARPGVGWRFVGWSGDLTGLDPKSFLVGDFIDAASLATRLKGSDDPVSTYLRSRLSAPTLSELAAWQAPAVPSDLLRTLVVRDLNGILWGPSIWTAARFQGVTLRQETRDLLPNPPFGATGAEVPRLNRFLLEDAYPLELSKYVHVLGAPAGSPVFFRATRTGP